MNDLPNLTLLHPAPIWKRALAQAIDLLVFSPFHFVMGIGLILAFAWGTILPFGLAVALYLPIPVALTALRGATPGKLLLRLRIVAIDAGIPGWRRAWNRQALFLAWLLFQVLALGDAVNRLGPGMDLSDPKILDRVYESIAENPSGWGWATQFCGMMIWGSGVLALLRADRRGFHDLWADTLVVEAPSKLPWWNLRSWRA